MKKLNEENRCRHSMSIDGLIRDDYMTKDIEILTRQKIDGENKPRKIKSRKPRNLDRPPEN